MNPFLAEQLFTTGALEFSPENQPFWYTSGLLGPFYINTHYLFGGRERAIRFLESIELATKEPEHLTSRLMKEVIEEIETNLNFAQLILMAQEAVRDLDFDIISGGERRDFFFSLPLAYALQKPHLAILKNGNSYLSQGFGEIEAVHNPDLEGKKVLHVADIVTAASSFTRQWIPVIRSLGGTITHALAMLDRCQGGSDNLKQHNVELISLGQIEQEFLDEAEQSKNINTEQNQMIRIFLQDPVDYMRQFLSKHPQFLEEELAKGGKVRERALLAIKNGFIISPRK